MKTDRARSDLMTSATHQNSPIKPCCVELELHQSSSALQISATLVNYSCDYCISSTYLSNTINNVLYALINVDKLRV